MFTMDFSKAFDKVKHHLLVEKLKDSPLNPYIVNWFVSFLANRKQRVIYDGVLSEWKEVNKGTTQGSVSGPYLFNTFVNELELEDHEDTSSTKYADDSTILSIISKGLPDKSNIALSTFMDRAVRNSMPCNAEKCKELILKKKGNETEYPMLYSIQQHSSFT